MPWRARKQCHLGIFLSLISSFSAIAFCSIGFRNSAALKKSQQNLNSEGGSVGFCAIWIAEKCVFSFKLCHQLPASPQANLPFDLSLLWLLSSSYYVTNIQRKDREFPELRSWSFVNFEHKAKEVYVRTETENKVHFLESKTLGDNQQSKTTPWRRYSVFFFPSSLVRLLLRAICLLHDHTDLRSFLINL